MNKNNEMALDTFADILIPLSTIMADAEIKDAYRAEGPVKAVSKAIKKHKKEVVEILALMDGVPVEEYEVSVMTLPVKVLKILNDSAVQSAFSGQGQKIG